MKLDECALHGRAGGDDHPFGRPGAEGIAGRLPRSAARSTSRAPSSRCRSGCRARSRTLDVRHKNASAAVMQQDKAFGRPAAKSGGGSGLSLDLTVNAPQRIFIQGRGLDAELGGSLRLTGPSVVAAGSWPVHHAARRLVAARQAFDLHARHSGFRRVRCARISTWRPNRERSDATVTVIVTGPANNPKILVHVGSRPAGGRGAGAADLRAIDVQPVRRCRSRNSPMPPRNSPAAAARPRC